MCKQFHNAWVHQFVVASLLLGGGRGTEPWATNHTLSADPGKTTMPRRRNDRTAGRGNGRGAMQGHC